jgi:hypothetical protein
MSLSTVTKLYHYFLGKLILVKGTHTEKMRIRSISAFITGFGFTLVAHGADFQFESGPQKTHLLELFTSEGCSSCPPAEAWLTKLKTAPGLWKNFVPLAFHVDYWDRLGWRDPFAAKEWTARQYRYSSRWNASSVYTPGFVLDGREWQNTGIPSAAEEAVGVLKVSFDKEGKLLPEFHLLKGDAPKFDFHVALLGFDLKTNVTGGENNGRNLQHDFVVLSLASEKMSDGKAQLSLGKVDARTRAIAAWVTFVDQIEPVQATGGWLP